MDYWEVRTLLALKRESSRSPDIKIQEIKNEHFNDFLNSVENKKILWEGEPKVKTLKGIKKYSFDYFNS